MTQSLLLWLIAITIGLFPTGTKLSIHFLPTNQRPIFFEFSKTLLPLSCCAFDMNTYSHMPMTQSDGKTVCWRNKSTSRWIASKRKPWRQPTAQASVSKVPSQMSRSVFPWNGKRWRVPWGLIWRNSRASPLLKFWGRSTAKNIFHEKGIVSSAPFDSVWWLGYKQDIS